MSTNKLAKTKAQFWCFCFGLGIFISTATFFPKNTVAQVIPDNTLPTNSRVTNPDNTNLIEGGTQAGGNLFHSFQQFSVLNNNTAFFNNGLDIQNIISRVTGGSVSNIDGLIRANGTANLFLINPSGIVFGPNAQLNIGGSFLASTANSFRFADGTIFSATTPQATPLLTISTPTGLQLGTNAGNIQNQSQLQVQPGKTLGLVGANIELNGGLLQATDGRIELAPITGIGIVGLNLNGNDFSLTVPQDITRGDISLTNRARVDVAGNGRGSIAINTQNLDILGGSGIFAGIKSGTIAPNPNSQDVTINATGNVRVLQQNSQINNIVERNGTGNAGNININARRLEINGGQIRSRTLGTGNAGNINVQAGDIFIDNPPYDASNFSNITLDDKPALDSGNFSNNSIIGIGRSGNISLEAQGSINLIGQELPENKVISTFNAGVNGGGSGDVSLKANGAISLNNALITLSTFGTGANAGNILIQGKDSLSLLNNSGLTATSFTEGNSGNITLTSSASVNIQNSLLSNTPGEATSPTLPLVQGNAGNIRITGKSVFVTDGSDIRTTSTIGSGSGDIQINATDTVEISGRAPTLTQTNRRSTETYSSLVTTTGQRSTGQAGDININVPNGNLRIVNGGTLRAETQGNFQGGSITLNARAIELREGGKVRADSTRGSGNAGNITLNGIDSVTISDSNIPNFDAVLNEVLTRRDGVSQGDRVRNIIGPSGVYASSSDNSTGGAGNLNINTRRLNLLNGAQVSLTSGQNNGGNITLELADILYLREGSQISTNAGREGSGGNGGNITINAPNGFLVALPNENSDITANAFTGAGGRVEIKVTRIFGIEARSRDELTRLESDVPILIDPKTLQSNDITAISQTNPSLEEQVFINTQDVDPSQGISEFPVSPINTSTLTDSSCVAFGPNSPNQFIITGRGGLPPSPNDPLTPDALWTDDRMVIIPNQDLKPQKKQESRKKTTTPASEMIPATGWVFNNKGEVMLVASNSNSLPYGLASIPCAR
jgi:filamentous hemagglutinin family protein